MSPHGSPGCVKGGRSQLYRKNPGTQMIREKSFYFCLLLKIRFFVENSFDEGISAF